MRIFDFFGSREQAEVDARPVEPHLEELVAPTVVEQAARPNAAVGQLFSGLDDPDLLAFMRTGSDTASGAYVSASKALQNMALLRCVTLISESIGMLPLNVLERGEEKKHAVDHPLYNLLKRRPNGWQTPYEFKSLLQSHVLQHGNGYARIIRSRGQITNLIPMHPTRTVPTQNDDWSLTYRYTRPNGTYIDLPASEVFHLRDLSDDGIIGLSRVKLAREALGIALQAERAAARLFKNGVMAGGALASPNALSDQAYKRLQDSLEGKSGADQAHKWMILEEGLKAEKWAASASDSQHLENRKHQIEEVARAFGVPRPLLMMDDTSWGSGIEQLAIFFVQYALQHWFTVWEEAAARSLLTPAEADTHYVKYNERALLRGTLKDQADFFAKALGSGGHAPWMTQNEVRDLQDVSRSNDPGTDTVRPPNTSSTTRTKNEPDKPA
ncbi:phage portal protein [Duganella sp. CY15W]|uniref:phage portal protein n=1 Tax=Duganella sp. CY15W TaxID=2692172 RepID=UPI00136BC1A2|nr:phage portal protein [Duganella sp. CY15W]MYM31492.1 phage portal protein [Duganella sp. CY15W]